jgi:hypothetical protein
MSVKISSATVGMRHSLSQNSRFLLLITSLLSLYTLSRNLLLLSLLPMVPALPRPLCTLNGTTCQALEASHGNVVCDT